VSSSGEEAARKISVALSDVSQRERALSSGLEKSTPGTEMDEFLTVVRGES